MDTCFLFSAHLDDEGCLGLKISSDGTLSVAPQKMTFAEIRSHQKDSQTLIVESCIHTSILKIELPWLPDRKARAAIPYALEDKLAQHVEELHFAFDKKRYVNHHYQVTVIAKQRLRYIMTVLDKQGISFTQITLDWFALEPDELCISGETVLINQDDFQGALSGTLALNYLTQHPQYTPLLFQDSALQTEDSPKQSEHSYVWIAKRLMHSKPLNLCQGSMAHGATSALIQKRYYLAGVLCLVWLVSIVSVNYIQLQLLNNKTTQVDQQIAQIYHQFFPDAKQVINPKFRITQLLGNNDASSQQRFWYLLNEFAKVSKNSAVHVEQLHYQNKTLSITVISPDFAHLEKIENQLKKAPITVKQTQASSHDQQVIATLELT